MINLDKTLEEGLKQIDPNIEIVDVGVYKKSDYEGQIQLLANRIKEILHELHTLHFDVETALKDLEFLLEGQKRNPHHKEYIADAINTKISKNGGNLLDEAIGLETPIDILMWLLENGGDRLQKNEHNFNSLEILSTWNYLEPEDLNDFFNFNNSKTDE